MCHVSASAFAAATQGNEKVPSDPALCCSPNVSHFASSRWQSGIKIAGAVYVGLLTEYFSPNSTMSMYVIACAYFAFWH